MALYTVGNGSPLAAQDINQLVYLLNGTNIITPVTVNNRIQALTSSAPFPSGYVGGTAAGAPTTGTFAVGDFIVDQTGFMWVCAVAGTPGTWYRQGGSNYACAALTTTTQAITSRSGQSGFDKIMLSAAVSGSDPHGLFRSGTNNIQVNPGGYYLCTGVVTTNGATATWNQASVLTRNGSIVSRGTEVVVSNGGSTTVADVISCNATDTISLGVYAEHACNVDTGTGKTILSLCLLS